MRGKPLGAYHGVSSHDVDRLVHEHLRGHERDDGNGADHLSPSLEVHLAKDRGVHRHIAPRETEPAKLRRSFHERVLVTRARARETTGATTVQRRSGRGSKTPSYGT